MFSYKLHHQKHSSILFKHNAALVLLAVAISGCSVLQQPPDTLPPAKKVSTDVAESTKPVINADDVMINDLLSAIVQIVPPVTTTVQIRSSDNTDIYQKVAGSFAKRGYGVKKVLADQGSMLVSTDIESELGEAGDKTVRLRISVGDTSVSRDYDYMADNSVQPGSAFRVYGSRTSIDIGATEFSASTPDNSPIADTEYVASLPLEESLPVLSLITPDIVQRVVDSTTNAPQATSLNSSRVEVNNLFYSDSTFRSIFDNRSQVDQLVVIFPNESIALGDENKLLVRRFTERFDEFEDVISVIGCSNGPTASELGNVGLALGRADRITDELLNQGIPRQLILDEGCWAPDENTDYPGRGVVLSRWRTQS